MAFKSIASYLDQIEADFGYKQSPAAIAKRLGIPGKAKTIAHYKAAVWDLRDIVADAKDVRAKKHETRRNQAINEIVSTLEVINLGKLRAKQCARLELELSGDDPESRKAYALESLLEAELDARLKELYSMKLEAAQKAEKQINLRAQSDPVLFAF